MTRWVYVLESPDGQRRAWPFVAADPNGIVGEKARSLAERHPGAASGLIWLEREESPGVFRRVA